jgi:hypothetical protein
MRISDTNDLPKLSQEDINNLHRSILSKEIEVLLVSQQRGAQDGMISLPNLSEL